jgi:hypothetical protein
MVAGDEAERYQRIWKHCAVHLAGSRDEVGRSVKSAMRHAETRALQ